ncbi:MAG: SAM-dependent chlorinase/fluorinase [Acidobacteriota bacterium]|nr:SAM-dependent chlorinase/fluorinase [Acidobacteriota bacterium]MDQ7088574.1 SAM-dependent chlorinase/fluorinase [Acidobacteriota bacterium]
MGSPVDHQPPPLITLTTDFGRRDSYVAEIKGVLLEQAPGCQLVDVTHDLERHDILAGGFVLACAAWRFPPRAVHLAVVDPGVGTDRRALVARCDGRLFVAPDNGLLTAVFDRSRQVELWSIEAARLGLPPAHPTFHGRDLFAPVAARLALGLDPAEVGPAVPDPRRVTPPPVRSRDGGLETTVLHVDHFGNVILALRPEHLGGTLPTVLETGPDRWVLEPALTYGGADPGRVLALWGSAGYLEIALARDSAARRLGLTAGDRVRLLHGKTSGERHA